MIKTKNVLIDKNTIRLTAEELKISPKFAELLYKRGYTDTASVNKFLHPDLKDAYDPFDFPQMKDAVKRLTDARDNGEIVVIYGDYDADGISATSVLYKSFKIFGIEEVYAVVPERENGYGLTEGVMENVLEAYCPDLIITVDCGISSYNEVEYLKDLGVDVIVTDHHEIPAVIPDCTVLNCKLHDGYPFDGLCGAGVAYKLAYALIGNKADAFLDMVAIATIADNMPLVDENRIIVSEGLKLIKQGRCRPAIKALVEISGAKEISSTALAYTIAPRINAAGRMGDAYSALLAMISDDRSEIRSLATKLNDYNIKRQTGCEQLYRDAKKLIAEKDPKCRAIVLFDSEWNTGLVGITAAKLVEEYHKPTILFTERNGVLHGSARSIEGINIFDAITGVKEYTVEFGGHAQAAGITVKKEMFDDFDKALNAYLAENTSVTPSDRVTEIEEVITAPFSAEFASELNLLEPCGIGNKKPLFAVETGSVLASPLKYGSSHVSFNTDYINLIYFNGIEKLTLLNSDIKKQIVFEPNLSYYNGKQSLKGYVRDIYTVASFDEKMSDAVFESQLGDFCDDGQEYEIIDTKTAREMIASAKKDVYGTLFLLSDANNMSEYKDLLENVDCGVFRPNAAGNVTSVCVGLKGDVPSEYGTVVYLDKPISVKPFHGKVYVNEDLSWTDISGLSTERQILGNIYKKIRDVSEPFAKFSDVIGSVDFGYGDREIIFALKVFSELGILKRVNGRYAVDRGVKCNLDDSPVYRRISKITGR